MKWSWRVGRLAGIDLYVHWTFLLLLGWIALANLGGGATLAETVLSVLFILAIFGCVVLHELGHALTARRYGVPTRDITLLPIGGVARLQRIPEHPTQEFWVAVAGPAVNVAITAGLFLTAVVLGRYDAVTWAAAREGGFLAGLLYVNVFLVAFNMLPAFPMDGGRVLRALLARRMDYNRATNIAANVGQGMAILFGIVGLFWNPFLIFIALFVYLGAEAEARMTQMKTALDGLAVRDAMMTRFRSLSPEDPLGVAADELLAGSQQEFPVVEDGEIRGVLRRDDLVRGLKEGGRDLPTGEAIQAEFCVASSGESLESAVQRLREDHCSSLLVVESGRLLGLVTLENLGELVMLRSALREQSAETETLHETVAGAA